MGLDPEFDDYEGGAACALCEDVIFDGKTPFYVEAWLMGLEQCPDRPAVPANGVYLLSQTAPCRWELFTGDFLFYWTLGEGLSRFIISSGPVFIFNGFRHEDCIDTVDNSIVACGPAATWGKGGWVMVFWGPTIGP